ncbi:arginine-glutamic acid dipeptide repeats protein-like isoform X2 [Neocloeon triangulifer]|uniref:arginine-glutamic acid dipeptide repeats protein-like isoform X2 n=1 Tax=Neocloeon triangulifer TaxID=2078957 RepID=UPI00286F64CC|nr:arginine-glutamic acid dipeptide repeats protein-like isoform X2 [Neocloeon triangulifer]
MPNVVVDTDLRMFLSGARSIAAFQGLCDGASPEDGYLLASRDDISLNAHSVLHDSGYNHGKALDALAKCPAPDGIDKKWSEEETKRFVKGLRQFGKNFFRIRKDLLPHKDTSELVEYYYLWKKTPGANNNRPHRRRRQGSLRRIRNTRNSRLPKESDSSVGSSRPSSKEQSEGAGSSASEEENSEDDSEGPTGFQCSHCFTTTSRDWAPLNKEQKSPILCSECRAHHKKNGELPPVPPAPPGGRDSRDSPYLFRPVQPDEAAAAAAAAAGRMRTRTRVKEAPARGGRKRGSGTDTPESEADKKCKSPSASSNSSSPSDKKKKKTEAAKALKRSQTEMENEDDKDTSFKRKKGDQPESPASSISSDSGNVLDEDANENEGEAEVLPEPEVASSGSGSPVIATPFPPSTPPVEPATPAEKPLIVPEDIKKEEPQMDEKPLSEEVEPPVAPSEAKPEEDVKEKVAEIAPEALMPVKEEATVIKLEPVDRPVSPEREEKSRPSIPPPPSQLLVSSGPFGGFLPPGPAFASSLSMPEQSEDSINQNEPQNLKIKQEIIIPPPPTSDMMIDPLQQLKEVKVPGYSPTNLVSTAVSQPLPPNSQSVESSPFSALDIKKELVEPPKSPKAASRPCSPRGSPAPAQATPPIRPGHSPLAGRASPSAPSPSATSTAPMVPISSAMGIPTSMASSPFVTHPALLHPSHHPAHHHAPHPLSYHPFHPHHHPAYPYPYPFPYPYPHLPPQLPPRMQSVPPSGAPDAGPTPPRQEEQQPSAPSTPSSSHKKHHRSTPPSSGHHSSSSSSHHHHHQSSERSSSGHHKMSSHHQSPGLMMHPGSQMMPSSAPSSLESLRAASHALQQQQQQQQQQQHSPQGPSPLHPLHHMQHHLPPHMSRHPMLPPEEPKSEADSIIPEEEEAPSPNHIPRGPSPEPKIEDTECHRSQSAIFLRHWNRGDYNSCARTDLTFKPVPDSKLARKREERMRKQAEREREEREKAAAQARKITTPDKQENSKPPSRGPIETITSPYDRFAPRPGYPDTPALRQLSEYARPHAGYSPGGMQRSGGPVLGLPPQCMDPMLQYHLSNMYGPGTRERLELEHLEREKREREMRELRERELNDRLKEELMKNAVASGAPRLPNPLDPHWLDLNRRYAAGPNPSAAAAAVANATAAAAAMQQYGMYPPSLGPGGQVALSPLERERLERLGYGRPGALIPRDPTLGIPHPADLLGRQYGDQIAHQLTAQAEFQRQLMMERDRFGQNPMHPASLMAQHDEYMRQQRDREMKVRALEEAARGSRP